MAMDFSAGAGSGNSTDLIPNGQLAFVYITYKGEKIAQSGTKLHELELTIDAGQPFERRKVFYNLMDPTYEQNSDGAKNMGLAAITRILEAGRWSTNPGFDQATFSAQGGYAINSFQDIHGLRAAIKIKITPAKDGYDAKNEVADFLTPNTISAAHKSWLDLIAGNYNKTAAAAPAGGFGGAPAAQGTIAFGGQAGASAVPQGGNPFAQASTVAPAPAAATTQQPAVQPGSVQAPAMGNGGAGQAAPFGQTAQPATTPQAAATPQHTASPQANAAPLPSSAAPGNSWLAQAQTPPAG